MKGNKAFTLIELLVVVLIIGILSAIALPQYKIAVIKSRATTILPLLKNLSEAQEAYYMTNEKYAGKLNELDIQLPNNCTHINFALYDSSDKGEFVKCDEFFIIDNDASSGIGASYCPGYNTSWNTCTPKRDFLVNFTFKHRPKDADKRYCKVANNSRIGHAICSAFGGFEYGTLN